MQIDLEPKQALAVINESKNLVLVTGPTAGADVISAMLAFYHAFKEFKKIRIVIPEEVPQSCHNLPESSVIERSLGPKILSINLATNGVPLTQVTYQNDNQSFRILIYPERRSFEVERVSYEYLGFSFDLFIFFGVKALSETASLFGYDFSEIYRNVSINLDVGLNNELFGSVNLIDKNSTSICESLFKMLGYWQLNFGREVSVCLLNGLTSLTLKQTSPLKGTPRFEEIGSDGTKKDLPSLPLAV